LAPRQGTTSGPARRGDPLAPYSSANQYVDMFGDAFQWSQSQYAPDQQILANQAANYNAQLGFNAANYGVKAGALQGQYGSDRAMIDTDYKSVGLDREKIGVGYDRNNLGREGNALDREGNVVDRGYIDRLRGLLGQTRGFAEADYKQRTKAREMEGQLTARDIRSDNVAKGSYFAPRHRGDQAANWLQTIADLRREDFSYGREKVGFDSQDAGYNRDYDKTFLADRQSFLSDRGIDLDDRELGIANRQLDIEAERLGIKSSQLSSQLTSGLQALGLDTAMNAQELMAMLASNDAQSQQLAQ
jgi:hypothetical protein